MVGTVSESGMRVCPFSLTTVSSVYSHTSEPHMSHHNPGTYAEQSSQLCFSSGCMAWEWIDDDESMANRKGTCIRLIQNA